MSFEMVIISLFYATIKEIYVHDVTNVDVKIDSAPLGAECQWYTSIILNE